MKNLAYPLTVARLFPKVPLSMLSWFYDNFLMSQYVKNIYFFNTYFQHLLLWYNKGLYSLYDDFLGVAMFFLICNFVGIPVISVF